MAGITIDISTFIGVRSKNICLQQSDKRFNTVGLGPLGNRPRIFLQKFWDTLPQNITCTDSSGRKQMELGLTTCFILV